MTFTEANVCHLLEGQCGLVSILVSEVVVHAKVSLPAELVTGLTVGNTFDHATLKRIKQEVQVSRTSAGYQHLVSQEAQKSLTPGAVATTLYGNTNRSKPTS